MANLKNLTLSSGEFNVPAGTYDARDSAGTGALSGDIRYNTSTSSMEFFDSASNEWYSFGSQKIDVEADLATTPEVTIRTFPTDSTGSGTNGTANVLWAVDCKLTATSQGMIAEYGGTGHGCAMGIDNGILRARAFNGDTWGAGSGNDRVLLETDVTEYCGDSATIYFAMEAGPVYTPRARLYIQPGGRGSSHYPILLGDDSASNMFTVGQNPGYYYIHGGNAKTYGSLYTSAMADLEANWELDYTNPTDIKEIRCYRHDSDLDLTNFAPHATRVKSHPIKAIGGTITTSGQWTFHTFTSNGTFSLTQQAQGVHSTRGVEIRYLAVGGGGGASKGGGGGGGVVAGTLTGVTRGEYTITVGAGGAANNATDTATGVNRAGTDGGNTTIAASSGHKGTTSSGFSVTAGGGGGGGGGNAVSDTAWRNGRNGLANNGSGGGGASWYGQGNGGTGNGTGGDGGDGKDNGMPYSHAGGGGASQNGTDFNFNTTYSRGNGGDGTTWYMNGTTYGGGGGGGGVSGGTTTLGRYGDGGSGGGANGTYSGGPTNSGTANTGGGGGGRKERTDTNAGAGGSGIVIIAYRTNPVDE